MAVSSRPADFEEFYRAELVPLIVFLVNRGFSLSDAEDAAADAMLEAHCRWLTLTHPAIWVRINARGRACRTARRLAEGVARVRAADRILVGEDDYLMRAIVEELPVLQELLGCLPETQRHVMAWHLDGYSNSEIAEALGRSGATVRSHLRHARNRLKLLVKTGEYVQPAPSPSGEVSS